MSVKAGSPIDLNKNELQNAVIQNLGTAPSSPSLAQIYADTSDSNNTHIAARLNVGGSATWVNLDTGFANPMTTLGDIIYENSTPAPTRLAGNTTTTKQFLSQTGNGSISAAPAWASLDAGDIQTGILGVSRGGTGIGTYTTGNYINAASSSSLQQRTPTQVRTDIGAVNINGDTMTGLLVLSGDPVTALGAATKQYVDNIGQGLRDYKDSARAATVGSNITLAGGAPNTLDGVTLAANDRILVKDQTAPAENGIYFVSTLGTGANGTWTRTTDANVSADVTSGLYIFIEEGTTNVKTAWVLSTANPITLGTTGLTFVKFSGLGQVTAGTGLTKTGDTLSITNTITAGGPTGSATVVPIITWNAQGQLTAVSSTTITGVSPVGSSLTSANIWVGNGSNVAAAVAVTGDISLTNAGAVTVSSATLSDSGTNTATTTFKIIHNSNGVIANNFGSITKYQLQDSTTAAVDAAEDTTTWVDATHATRKARKVFNIYDTAIREAFRIEASGSAAKIGFLGASAALQQTGDAGTALVTFGLMSGTPTFAGANITGVVPLATNINGGTTGQIPYQSAANTTGFTGPGSSGQVLQSAGAAQPVYSTATYPSTATSTGVMLRANGTNWVASTSTFADTYTASNLLYSNGSNTVTGLATANNGVLVTSGSGVPSISSILPAGIQVASTNSISAAGSTQGTATALTTDLNAVTTVGSGQGVVLPASVAGKKIIVVNRGANTLLVYPPVSSAIDGLGTNTGYSMPVNTWAEFDCISSTLWYSSLVVLANSSTNLAGGTTGQVPYQSAAGTTLFTGPGTSGQLLQSAGAAQPVYTTATYPGTGGTTGTILRSNGTNWVNSTSTFSDTYTASNLLYSNGSNTVTGLATANNGVLVTSGSGVPSISSILPAGIQITTTNSISAAGSTQGTATALTTDFNVVTTTGSGQGVILPASVAGKVIRVSNRGANALLVYPPTSSAIDALGTNVGYSLPVNAWVELDCISSTQWYSSAVGAVANATNISGGTAGQVVYQSAPSTTGFTGPGSTGQVLQSNGTSAPTYSTATYPSTGGTSGTMLRSNGTNFVNSTSTFADTYTASNLLYSNGSNTVTGLATANNGVLVTSGSGVPSISSVLPTGIQVTVTTGITAAGSTQGTATALTTDTNVVSTVGAGQGVILPASVAGKKMVVINTGANALLVYPPVSSAIDALGTNVGYSLPVNGIIEYDCVSTTQWYSHNVVSALGYTPTQKYTTTITGAGPGFTITHNLNTKYVTVSVYDNSDNLLLVDTQTTTVNTVTLTFGVGAPGGNTFRVVVIG